MSIYYIKYYCIYFYLNKNIFVEKRKWETLQLVSAKKPRKMKIYTGNKKEGHMATRPIIRTSSIWRQGPFLHKKVRDCDSGVRLGVHRI